MVSPLNAYVPMVDPETGTPSPQFLQFWQEQLGTNETIPDSAPKLSLVMDEFGDSQGGVLYRGSTSWAALAAGTARRVLMTGGVGVDPAWGQVKDSDLSLSDVTANNVSTARHGFAPKAPNDATKFLDGAGAYDTVKDSDLSLSDVPANNVSTDRHGFAPKAPNDAAQFLNGLGAWAGIPFTALSDAPSPYTGESGKIIAVNGAEDGLVFVEQAGDAAYLDPADNFLTVTSAPMSTSAFASKGNVFTMTTSRILTSVAIPTAASGQTLKMVVAEVGGANPHTITSLVAETAESAVGGTDRAMNFVFDKGVALESGLSYAFIVARTDGTDTSACGVPFASTSGTQDQQGYFDRVASIRYASNDPTVGDDTFNQTTTVVQMRPYHVSPTLKNVLGPATTVIEQTSAFSITNAHLSGLHVIEANFAAAADITVPGGLTGTEPVDIVWAGAGQPTIVEGAGVYILSADNSRVLRTTGSQVRLVPRGPDVYSLWGDMVSDSFYLLEGDEAGYLVLEGDEHGYLVLEDSA